MKLHCIDNTGSDIPSFVFFEKISRILDLIDGEQLGQINLVFCKKDTIRKLNKTYRNIDKVTDVLSFLYSIETEKTKMKNSNNKFYEELIGEVFICIDQTKRQSDDSYWSEKDLNYYSSYYLELYKLCIHGLLHLRGYDHIIDSDYRVMKLLEDKVMKSFLESENS